MIATNSNFVTHRIFVLLLVLISLSTQALAKENFKLGSQNRNSNKSEQHDNIPKDTATTPRYDTISMRSYLRADPRILQSRYGFTSTAIPLGKGNGYAQLSLVGFSRVVVGITKNITAGVGAGLLSMLDAEGPEIPHTFVAIGGQISKRMYVNLEMNVAAIETKNWLPKPVFNSILYHGRSVITYSHGRWNISGGIGYGIQRIRQYSNSSNDSEMQSVPLIAPSLQYGCRFLVTRKFSLFFENIMIPKKRYSYFMSYPIYSADYSIYFLQYPHLAFNFDFKRGNLMIGAIGIMQPNSYNEVFPSIDFSMKF
jgi:hypothetical protein